MSEIDPCSAPIQLAPNLYIVDGDWKKTKLRRRMTVIILKSKELVLHSPIRMSDPDIRKVEAFGKVRYIVAPNVFHGSDVPWFAERFPTAKIYAPERSVAKLNLVSRVTGSLEKDWPLLVQNEIQCIPIAGARMGESVFFHESSKTLVCTDLVFNMGAVFTGLEKVFMNWNQVGGRFGPSRILRWFFVNNRAQFSESLRELAKLDFERVIMNHGEIVESNGHEKFEAAFQDYLRA